MSRSRAWQRVEVKAEIISDAARDAKARGLVAIFAKLIPGTRNCENERHGGRDQISRDAGE
jgi:hypothetical protein